MKHSEFALTSADGLNLAGQLWEPETTPRAVVCLVHGLGEHIGRYAHVGAALNDARYALFGCDLRGHGRSGGPRGHTPSYLALMDDITGVLVEATRRYPGKPQFLYGHSMGGNLVINYVLRCRPSLAGVVASGPALRLGFEPPAMQLRLARLMDRVMPTFTQTNGLDHQGLSHDSAVVDAYEKDALVHDRVTARLALSVIDAGQWAIDHASEFPLPLLIFHGSADRLTSPLGSQEFADKAPGCTLKLWDDLYHETHNEPEQANVLRLMIAWLQEYTPA